MGRQRRVPLPAILRRWLPAVDWRARNIGLDIINSHLSHLHMSLFTALLRG